jgi:hypothetical protein
VLSKLDESILQSIALNGNGKYYRASADGSELQSLISEIDNLQKDQLQNRIETRQIERYQIFLALTLILIVISEVIPDRLIQQISPSWIGRKRRNQPEGTSPSFS